MVLTDPDQLDERDSEVVLVRDVRVNALLVDADQGEAKQRQQRRYGEAEVELHQAWQLRPGLYLQEVGEDRKCETTWDKEKKSIGTTVSASQSKFKTNFTT